MTFKGSFQPELFYDSTTNPFNYSSVLLGDPTVSPSGSQACTLGASDGNYDAMRPLAVGSIEILGLCHYLRWALTAQDMHVCHSDAIYFFWHSSDAALTR